MLKGTKTAVNLMKSFAGESQARMRYTYFAKIAKKQGYMQISNIFLQTAEQEKEHAKKFYKYLKADFEDEAIEINASYPVSFHDETLKNLKASINGEHEEGFIDYPEFAKIAKEEGFDEISEGFLKVSEVEKRHEIRYKKLADSIENGTTFKKESEVLWMCLNCGYVTNPVKEAPQKCPTCQHPQGYFELFSENY